MTLDTVLSWYALRVKTGRELAVWEEIAWRFGFAGFVPRELRRVPSRRRSTKLPKLLPLTPSYAFAGVNGSQELVVLREVDDVLGVLRAGGEPARLCPRSIKQIETMSPIERFRSGGSVTIIEGPYAGRRAHLRSFVAGKAHIDIPGAARATIPLEHLEAA